MIYICTHCKPSYTLDCPYEIINNEDNIQLSEQWRHLRGMQLLLFRPLLSLPKEIGIFQRRRQLIQTSIPEGYDIVAPKNFHNVKNIRAQYKSCSSQNIEHLDLIEQIIGEKSFSEYIRKDNNPQCYFDNMFIMYRNDYIAYCTELFRILNIKTEKVGDENNCFLAERIGSYLKYKFYKILSKTVQSNKFFSIEFAEDSVADAVC